MNLQSSRQYLCLLSNNNVFILHDTVSTTLSCNANCPLKHYNNSFLKENEIFKTPYVLYAANKRMLTPYQHKCDQLECRLFHTQFAFVDTV